MTGSAKMAVHLTDEELRFLIRAMEDMQGCVTKEEKNMRYNLEALFRKALDFSPPDEGNG